MTIQVNNSCQRYSLGFAFHYFVNCLQIAVHHGFEVVSIKKLAISTQLPFDVCQIQADSALLAGRSYILNNRLISALKPLNERLDSLYWCSSKKARSVGRAKLIRIHIVPPHSRALVLSPFQKLDRECSSIATHPWFLRPSRLSRPMSVQVALECSRYTEQARPIPAADKPPSQASSSLAQTLKRPRKIVDGAQTCSKARTKSRGNFGGGDKRGGEIP